MFNGLAKLFKTGTKDKIVPEQPDSKEEKITEVETPAATQVSERPSFYQIKINMESQFYHINLLQLLLKWKVHLAVIVLIASVLAAIFSGPVFITPKYKSEGIIYPANISSYSDENETEQMLQILNSRDISDSIIARFNLSEHYEISKDYEHYYSVMMWEYWQNVTISKTPNEAVSIEVLDKDPQIASDMVDAMIYFYNNKVRNLHETKFLEVVQMYERMMAKKKAYLDSLNMQLTHLSTEYGLMDYEAQSEQVTKGYLKTIDGSGANHVNQQEVNRLKENIEKKGGEMLLLQNLIEQEAGRYSELKAVYEQAYMDFDRKFSYTNVLTSPYPNDKKAYPIRWLIVVLAALASFFISFVVILILESYPGLTKKNK